MKKSIPLLFTAMFLLATVIATAQSTTGPAEVQLNLTCKEITVDQVNKIHTMTGNVTLVTELATFESADKIVYFKESGKLIVYNCRNFTLKGGSKELIVDASAGKGQRVIEYSIGSGFAIVKNRTSM